MPKQIYEIKTDFKLKLPSWVNTIFSIPSKKGTEVFDMKRFKEAIEKIKSGNKIVKQQEIEKVIELPGLLVHHKDKQTGRKVLAICDSFEYPHEEHTAQKLAARNYDIVLVPEGYFGKHQKKFDVFLLRGHIILEADLKCITTTNPDTIGKRIKGGSDQSSRVVLDIISSIEKNDLINGLKTGCERNDAIIEIMLFYNSNFYCLKKDQILSKNIYKAIK